MCCSQKSRDYFSHPYQISGRITDLGVCIFNVSETSWNDVNFKLKLSSISRMKTITVTSVFHSSE
jgi:hypothetical protein